MNELIEKIQVRLSENAYPNEASISFGVVIPILRALGWDDSDPMQVRPEYATGGRRVDFALCASGNKPNIFVEVKGVGRSAEGDRQLFEYAFHEGVPICLLTDGRDWSFYLPSGQGTYEERRIYRLQLDERNPPECKEKLVRYLDKTRVKSGDAFDDAQRDYKDNSSRREASRIIPKAWQTLVDQPEDLLIDLLTEQTEAICGFQPSSADILKFLHSLRVTDAHSQKEKVANKQQIIPTETRIFKVDNNIPDSVSFLGQDGITFFAFNESYHAKTATAALVTLLSLIVKRYPDRMNKVANAMKGTTRNHIAKSPEEIYPKRPDLARAAEIGDGWLVGLNIANREKIVILRKTCDAVGIEFGKDIRIQLPNVEQA